MYAGSLQPSTWHSQATHRGAWLPGATGFGHPALKRPIGFHMQDSWRERPGHRGRQKPEHSHRCHPLSTASSLGPNRGSLLHGPTFSLGKKYAMRGGIPPEPVGPSSLASFAGPRGVVKEPVGPSSLASCAGPVVLRLMLRYPRCFPAATGSGAAAAEAASAVAAASDAGAAGAEPAAAAAASSAGGAAAVPAAGDACNLHSLHNLRSHFTQFTHAIYTAYIIYARMFHSLHIQFTQFTHAILTVYIIYDCNLRSLRMQFTQLT